MVAIIVTFIVAVLLLGPSFALLFTLQSRRLRSADGRRPGRPLRAGGGSPSPAAVAERAPRPAARSATLGMIAIAAIIRRRRRHGHARQRAGDRLPC
jgi:hypothetical protein